MVYSNLDDISALALDLYLSQNKNELQQVHSFLKNRMPTAVLAAQQIVHFNGATDGSYNWDRWSACKMGLYGNPCYRDTILSDWDDLHIPLAISFKDLEEVLSVSACVERLQTTWKRNLELVVRVDRRYFGAQSPMYLTRSLTNLSNMEWARVVLGVYQFNAFCRLLNNGELDMTFQQAAALAKMFLKYLTPWEKE